MSIKKSLKAIGISVLAIVAMLFIGFLVLFIATREDYSIPRTVEHVESIPHIEVDNVLFHAETFGSDTSSVVIVIHGGPGNDYRYLLPLKALSEKYHVVFYDQRGAGLSLRVPASEHSLENSLKDLSGIFDFYAPNREVNIIGHSWWAMLAEGYIAQNPHRVSKAVLAEPGMLTSEKAKEYMVKFKINLNWSTIKAMTIIAFESLRIKGADSQARIDYIFGRIGTLDVEGNPMRKYFCNENMQNGHLPFWRLSGVASQSIIGKAMDKDGNIQIDLVTGLDRYTRKLLFVVGECNQIIGKDYQAEHIKYFPNADMVVVKNAGHTMFGERTDECIEIIEGYFSEM